jgi:hypothetical protein
VSRSRSPIETAIFAWIAPRAFSRAKQAAAMCVALLAEVRVAARAAHAGAATATWMGGPGCGGRIEWRQHPATFPYFCDGAAVIEHVRWRNWGKTTATAHGTMNEADLRHGASVGTAPRIHSAITLTATHIETCSGRRAYTSIGIRFDKPHKGPRTLRYPTHLPHCSATSPPSGSSSPRLWSALEGKVECGPTAPPLAELLCQSRAIPPPPTSGEGDSGFVFLQATGAPMVARVSQLLWPEYGPFTPLAAGATWSDKALQITCNVEANEIRCSNGSANGFTISQTSYAPL